MNERRIKNKLPAHLAMVYSWLVSSKAELY